MDTSIMAVNAAQGILEAFGAISGAKDQAKQLNQAAEIDEYNAGAALRQSNFNANQFYKQFNQNMGKGIAQIGGSNLRSDTFDALVLQNVEEAAIQAENIRYEGTMTAYNLKNEAKMKRYQAQLGKYNARMGAIGALFGSAVTGYMQGKKLQDLKPNTGGKATGAPINLVGAFSGKGGSSLPTLETRLPEVY